MKKIVCFLLLSYFICSINAQNQAQICRLGFNTEMSNRYCWGIGKPIVVSVTAGSPAEKAGLKINDIIERISGIETIGRTSENIFALLHEERFIKLTVSNISYKNKEITFSKDCIPSDVISENQMVSAFPFYSLEDIQERTFACPFKTSIQECSEFDFLNYKTFGFAKDGSYGSSQGKESAVLNGFISKALEERGLKYRADNPDFVITTFYKLDDNARNYSPSENQDKLPQEWRYDINKKKFVKLPVYYNALIHERNVRYYGELKIQFVDKRSTDKKTYVIWECEARDAFAENYNLKNYAEINIPLMLMQYPYSQTEREGRYRYLKKCYNYTGVNYDMNNFKRIAYIDPVSPAAQAGLKEGDEILFINGLKAEAKSSELSSAYRNFIEITMPFRDEKTKYTDANGYDKCMEWDVFSYPKVETEIRKPKNKAVFSYLFNFKPYINMLSTNIVFFEIKRGKETLAFKVEPIVVSMESFENE